MRSSVNKIVKNSIANVAFLLFLILIGEDCLRWYIIPLPNNLHRILFAGMTCLSSVNCLFALLSLVQVRRIQQRAVLKLLAATPAMETKAESGVYYARLSLMAALCFYIVAAVWGIIYLSGGPFVRTGYGALSIFVAYHVMAIVAGAKLERLKLSIKPKQAKV